MKWSSSRAYCVVATAAIGICVLSRPLPAQVVTADIVGTKTDSSGGSLVNVKVTAQNALLPPAVAWVNCSVLPMRSMNSLTAWTQIRREERNGR
jgi:hypothetical protein